MKTVWFEEDRHPQVISTHSLWGATGGVSAQDLSWTKFVSYGVELVPRPHAGTHKEWFVSHQGGSLLQT